MLQQTTKTNIYNNLQHPSHNPVAATANVDNTFFPKSQHPFNTISKKNKPFFQA